MRSGLPFVSVCEHTLFEPDLGPNCLVVDLGANRGEFSRTLAHRYGCTCLAVEPSPTLYEQIEETPSVHKYRYAIWSEVGDMKLHVSSNSECSSLLSLTAHEVGQEVSVPAVDLETFVRRHAVPRIDLLKVDIEGAEIAAFTAVSDDLLRSVTQISVEFHDFNQLVNLADIDALRLRLARLGFLTVRFSLRSHFDVLFLNRRLSHAGRRSRWMLALAPYYLKALRYLGLT